MFKKLLLIVIICSSVTCQSGVKVEFPLLSALDSIVYKYGGESMNISDTLDTILNYFTPSGPGVSQQCLEDGEYLKKNIYRGWALKMIDATGKLPGSGALQGALQTIPGNVYSCLEVDATRFKGKYCILSVGDKVGDGEVQSRSIDPEAIHQIGGRGALLAPLLEFIAKSKFEKGHCVPDSCSESDVEAGWNNFLVESGVETNGFVYSCKDNSPVDVLPADYVVLLIVLIFVCLVVVGTILDVSVEYLDGHLLPENIIIMFQGFSLRRTLVKIFHVGENKDNLSCINGIRFLSMFWVIAGHSYLAMIEFPPFISNKAFILEIMEQYPMKLIFNATPSVDSFFLIGSTLLAFLTLKELDKKNIPSQKFWTLFYIHRYIRLTGVYAVVIALSATLFKFIPTGPHNYLKQDTYACQEAWWMNILYINNFHAELGQENCMGWTWYMANDMQMFIISPLFILALYHLPVFGITISILSVLGTIGFRVWRVQDRVNVTFDNLYNKPYSRFGSYAVGLILGYILYRTKHIQNKSQLPKNIAQHMKIIIPTCWCVSLVSIYLIIFGPDLPTELTDLEFTIYQSVFRTAWSISLAWLIFACAKGYGGAINSFLSWSFWSPLAKISYSCYLVHFFVIHWTSSMPAYNLMISQPYLIYMVIANTVVCMGCGLLMVLLFEAPIMHLEKLLFGFLGISKLPTVEKPKAA